MDFNNQVLIVDADTIIHPDTPNFFNETDGKFGVVVNNGCYEWVKNNCKERGFNSVDLNGSIDIHHPNDYGHEMFTKEIILPFLKNINVR